MLSVFDNINNGDFPWRMIRVFCGTCRDLLCSVVQIALWLLVRQSGRFKLIKSIS